MRRHAPLLALLLVLLICPVVAAQTAIDRGQITFSAFSSSPRGEFRFEGPQMMTVIGGLREGLFFPTCDPCTGGQLVTIGGIYTGDSSFFHGTLTTGSETRPVYFAGNLHFYSSQMTMPTRYSRLPFTLVVPITAEGNLQVHGTNPFISGINLLFDFPVNLHGKATVTFKLRGILPLGQPFYDVVRASYEFPLAEKVEEN
jgi:hypothetical protein